MVKALKETSRNVFRWVLALVLLPLAWVAGWALLKMVPAAGAEGVRAWWLYAAGTVFYLFIEKVVWRPLRIYVIGHEVTHVLSGWLSGAKVHSFKAHAKGGEVRLSKSNTFVALSPYIVPIYTALVVVVYAVLQHWWKNQFLTPCFQFLVGVTLMLHLSMTASAIHLRQPDLKMVGIFLSGVLIILGNALILGLMGVSLFSKTPTFKQYMMELAGETMSTWKTIIKISRNQWTH